MNRFNIHDVKAHRINLKSEKRRKACSVYTLFGYHVPGAWGVALALSLCFMAKESGADKDRGKIPG